MHISSQCRAKRQTWLPRPGLVIVVSDMPAGPLRRLRAGRSRHRTVTFPVVPAPPVDDTCRFPCRLKTPSGGSPAGPDRVTMKAVLDVRRLLVLRAVARHGSIAAARALGYSQPAVSHHIHRLEAETGVRLVIRDGRGVTLTDAGQSMVARADTIAAELAAAEAQLAAFARNDAVWMAAVVESQWLDADAGDPAAPIGVGRRGRMVMKLPGRRAEFIDEVIEYEPGRRIAHPTVQGPIPLRTACLCEPAGDACRATVVGEVDPIPGGVFGRLAAPVVTGVIRRGFKTDLAKLKNILEAGARPTGDK